MFWLRIKKYCCGCCWSKKVHPYAPAMSSMHTSRVPSVIDLGPNITSANANAGETRDRDCVEFSVSSLTPIMMNQTGQNIQATLCENTAVSNAQHGNQECLSSPSSITMQRDASQTSCAPAESILRSINHTWLEQQQNRHNASGISAVLQEVIDHQDVNHDNINYNATGTVPERVQRGLRRSSMYQDPFHTLHFIVLSTDQIAIRVALDKVTREQFEALLKLHSNPTDTNAIREACQLCRKLGHAFAISPLRMEISAGLLHVPLQDLEQRMQNSRNAALMLRRNIPDSPV